jgi:ABC-type bacteriocin/lantibiotic exporter with double-glycine peptidase domain
LYFILFQKKPTNKINSKYKNKITSITEQVITFFNNINIIVEKDKMKEELSNLFNSITKAVSDKDFISSYQMAKINKNRLAVMNKGKILETIVSLIVNDSYLFILTSSVKGAMIKLSENVYIFKRKLKVSNEIIDILTLHSYRISNPIFWNHQDKPYEYLFVLENVSVEYKENEKYTPVFTNVNLSFEINSIHFIYGNSGSGKTTLVNTLMKKVKTKNGSIKFLNEYDNYTYFSIRKYLTYLTSESILFSKSIYYNIIFGMNKNVLKERNDDIYKEIIKYMGIFNMNNFISDIDSKNSIKLSKGQTQRIAIIRLFINIIFDNVKILFLDEFTSNIDNNMEKTIFNELLQLHSRFPLTIFFISHNIYNMKYSDFNYKFNVDERSISKRVTNKDDILCLE